MCALVLGALTSLCGSCAAPANGDGLRVSRASIDPAFEHAFATLEAAVWADDDPLARRVLEQIRVRGLGAAEEALADSYERILDGRALVSTVELELELTAGPEGGRQVLSLVGRHSHATDLTLHLPPATLRRKVTALTLRAGESAWEASDAQSVDALPLPAFDGFVLPAGERAALPLLEITPDDGGSLAVRERWSLELRSGEIGAGDEFFPAQGPAVRPVEFVTRAPWLPTAPVEPAELVRYARSLEISTAALLERAVRIETERRGEAIALLRPLVDEFDDGRMAELVPALRWLSGSIKPGSDPAAWRHWLRYRGGPSQDEERDRGLDLPDRLSTNR